MLVLNEADILEDKIRNESDDHEAHTTTSMRRRLQQYALQWINLAPDDMELSHRYSVSIN